MVLAQTKEVFNNYNSSVECSNTGLATFTLKEALRLSKAMIWYDFGNSAQEVKYTLSTAGRKVVSGIVQKGDCARGYTWCNGLMEFGDLEPDTYTVAVSPARICHNPKHDGGNGFIRISGIPKTSTTNIASVVPGKPHWRQVSVTVANPLNVPNPWSHSFPCKNCITYSWTIQKDPPNTLTTQRAMCADCWGLKKGKTWGGHATWTLLPKDLIPETKIPIHIEVSGGQLSWMWVFDGQVIGDPGKPTMMRNFEFRVPSHGGYAEFSKPTLTFSLRFSTSSTDANGNVQRGGDPDLTIYYTYEWVGK